MCICVGHAHITIHLYTCAPIHLHLNAGYQTLGSDETIKLYLYLLDKKPNTGVNLGIWAPESPESGGDVDVTVGGAAAGLDFSSSFFALILGSG